MHENECLYSNSGRVLRYIFRGSMNTLKLSEKLCESIVWGRKPTAYHLGATAPRRLCLGSSKGPLSLLYSYNFSPHPQSLHWGLKTLKLLGGKNLNIKE